MKIDEIVNLWSIYRYENEYDYILWLRDGVFICIVMGVFWSRFIGGGIIRFVNNSFDVNRKCSFNVVCSFMNRDDRFGFLGYCFKLFGVNIGIYNFNEEKYNKFCGIYFFNFFY